MTSSGYDELGPGWLTTMRRTMTSTDASEPAWCTTTPRSSRRAVRYTSTDGLKSVATALDLLECFAADGELGVSDIARKLGIAKSTAHRLLTTLCSRGIAEQNPETGQYRLGIHLYELGHLTQARNLLRHVALPTLSQLAQTTGHTVNLSVIDGADVVFIERLEARVDGRILDHAGRRYPSHCTSSGKAIAAYHPEAAQARRDSGFPPRVSGTLRSVGDWDRQLVEVRRRGFAVSSSETFDNVTTVAVPILDLAHRAIGAVSILGPSDEITPDIDRLARLLQMSARRISRGMSR
jgi:DNA-binding IclR family transcriptional regulator